MNILVTGVEVVEGEVIASIHDVEFVRLPVVVIYNEAVSIALACKVCESVGEVVDQVTRLMQTFTASHTLVED